MHILYIIYLRYYTYIYSILFTCEIIHIHILYIVYLRDYTCIYSILFTCDIIHTYTLYYLPARLYIHTLFIIYLRDYIYTYTLYYLPARLYIHKLYIIYLRDYICIYSLLFTCEVIHTYTLYYSATRYKYGRQSNAVADDDEDGEATFTFGGVTVRNVGMYVSVCVCCLYQGKFNVKYTRVHWKSDSSLCNYIIIGFWRS